MLLDIGASIHDAAVAYYDNALVRARLQPELDENILERYLQLQQVLLKRYALAHAVVRRIDHDSALHQQRCDLGHYEHLEADLREVLGNSAQSSRFAGTRAASQADASHVKLRVLLKELTIAFPDVRLYVTHATMPRARVEVRLFALLVLSSVKLEVFELLENRVVPRARLRSLEEKHGCDPCSKCS